MRYTPMKYTPPTLPMRFKEILIMTLLRHVAKRIIFIADNYIVSLTPAMKKTTIRCSSCSRLCRYSYDNPSYDCTNCRTSFR